MRLSAQNNQFIFNLPLDLIEPYLSEQFQKLLDKNFMPYDSVIDYVNSTIKEVVFPAASFNTKEQIIKRGKSVSFKAATSVYDTFTNELDITFRSVDSYINYFILLEVLVEFYLNTEKHHIPMFNLQMLDKDGCVIYSIEFREVLLKSIGELRLGYNMQDIDEKTFTITFRYNFIDINWMLTDDPNEKDGKSIFDLPLNVIPGKLDNE